MNVRDIATLYAYNAWANSRVLVTVRQLDPSAFTRDLGASYRSIRGTLVHILWAEWIWLQRWNGESPKVVFAPDNYANAAAVEMHWLEVERAQQDLIARLTDERLAERVTYENLQGEQWTYSLGHMMQHVVNHSSYHRGQVTLLVRQLGEVPLATDFLIFFDEHGGPPGPGAP